MKHGQIVAHNWHASSFTWQVENKHFKASVLWMNDSRIHRNIKIARDDSAVTLGCSDWCGLALNAWERISEQAFIFHSKSGWCSTWGFLHCDDRRSLDELTAVDLSVIAVALTPAWLVWILTVMPVWLYFFIIPVLFFITKLYLLYEC